MISCYIKALRDFMEKCENINNANLKMQLNCAKHKKNKVNSIPFSLFFIQYVYVPFLIHVYLQPMAQT